ncbi:class I SAM-dependent methyltransferase [Pseudomonadales bacterium]|jgi:ubiquinone/menaquinone biosynthesis C-methylase UbiE|nr:class I SAM-dependent methyltransferase [Pseudomonadales bacterium]MDB2543309.1 class I SAM-dependent methyltransferase [Pseudomonadales bacterium]
MAPRNPSQSFFTVTERAGEWVSPKQLQRFLQRYQLAGRYCSARNTVEVACGTAPGAGYLESVSKDFLAGDISAELVDVAVAHYGDRVKIKRFDATEIPVADESIDALIIYEAIYYLPSVEEFLTEARRVLRSGGILLIATANKDLMDFNPSDFSVAYYNPPELVELLSEVGFEATFFGGSPVSESGVFGLFYRQLKRWASKAGLIPKTMKGKKLLKLLFSGGMVKMPVEMNGSFPEVEAPRRISADTIDLVHEVIYCAAEKIST